jgi:two-component system sensor histidine kinase KdpD
LAGRSDWQSQCAFAQKLLSRRLRAEVKVVANVVKPEAEAGVLQLQLGKNAAVGWLLLPEPLLLPNHTLVHAAQSLLNQSYAALELKQQANKNLLQVESEQQRAMLLRSLSHDLRTPLATIMGASSMLADTELPLTDEQRQQQALNIYRHSKLLHQHFEKVLELSKAQLADVQLKRSHFSSDDLIAGAIARRSDFSAELATVLACPPPQALTGDADLLEIALANLLENALKYGAAPMVLQIKSADGWQRLELKNAVPQHQAGTTTAADAGHGLGIRICETVAALHGGRFQLQLSPAPASATEALAVLEWPL